ncbi:phosphotransferase [Nocardiopsis halotolerans]|uniref:phosphotransferase n=1 Tax=Nocardiopsis halotolerans TaxID=124252 RepID=UPI0003496254|nr:phosphotransferase [Nocardiopsis halotolerans]
MTEPSLLASGRDADVFALDEHTVLRRNRDGRSPAREAAVMAHAAAHGYPVPAVHRVEGPDLVMERLYGHTMLHAGLSGSMDAEDMGRTLAGLQGRLHRLPAPSGTGGLLHMDLHPDNVVLTPAGPVVIDWTNAGEGDPDLDVAMTALIFAQVALSAPPPLSEVAARGLEPFLRHTAGDPVRLLDRVADMRAGDPNQTPEERAVRERATGLVRSLRSTAR